MGWETVAETYLVCDAGLEPQQFRARLGGPVDPGDVLVQLGRERRLGRVLLGRVGLRGRKVLQHLNQELTALLG